MTNLLRPLRGVLIALVALAMSTGIAFAAHPAATGLANAATHANKTVPVQATGDESGTEVDETGDTTETEDTEDASDNCTTDPTGLTPEQLAAMTHGSIVCWAAQQDTPDGYANHGAWVSHWAHMGKGADASTAGKAKGAAGKAKGLSHQQ